MASPLGGHGVSPPQLWRLIATFTGTFEIAVSSLPSSLHGFHPGPGDAGD